MSSRKVEAKIEKHIDELRNKNSYADAAFIENKMFLSKGYLPHLLELCEDWNIILTDIY